MQFLTIQRILGILLALFSITMLPPVLVSLLYQDGEAKAFITAFGLLLSIGALLWLPARKHRKELKIRDGFIVVVMFWLALGFSGSLPFFLSTDPLMSFTDSVFESMSGLTTTGSTVLTGLDDLPKSILFYRQFLQWLGGMGLIVLAVAIPWLAERYEAEVVVLTLDLGQGGELTDVRERALTAGRVAHQFRKRPGVDERGGDPRVERAVAGKDAVDEGLDRLLGDGVIQRREGVVPEELPLLHRDLQVLGEGR